MTPLLRKFVWLALAAGIHGSHHVADTGAGPAEDPAPWRVGPGRAPPQWQYSLPHHQQQYPAHADQLAVETLNRVTHLAADPHAAAPADAGAAATADTSVAAAADAGVAVADAGVAATADAGVAAAPPSVQLQPIQERIGSDGKISGSWQADGEDGRFLLPYIYTSTLTAFSIASITSTLPLTCIASNTGSATACTGRRRRRRRYAPNGEVPWLHGKAPQAGDGRPPEDAAPQVWSSARQEQQPESAANDADGSRLVLTSWVTVVSSVTSVSTVTTYDTTLSLDLLCTIGGVAYFPTCAG